MISEESICEKVARLYSGRDWHKLTKAEQEIVSDLEKVGWFFINEPTNGFVGRVNSNA